MVRNRKVGEKMSIAKTGAIPNSYRQVHIAVDDFEKRILKGRIYHESKNGGIAFYSLSEMVFVLEELFDEIHYPMKSVDPRNFGKKDWLDLMEDETENRMEMLEPEDTGKLADFRLHVQYRYYASWQGVIEQLGSEVKSRFNSFMELMDFFDQQLGSGVTRLPYGLGKKMCEVAVRNYEDHNMSGDVSHPAVEDRRIFYNEFELREKIAEMIDPLPENAKEHSVIIPRSFYVENGNYGPATFVVRVLFRRNATWQGTIGWKEKRCQVSFRSFMELLLLMHEAVARSGQWQKKTVKKQIYTA